MSFGLVGGAVKLGSEHYLQSEDSKPALDSRLVTSTFHVQLANLLLVF